MAALACAMALAGPALAQSGVPAPRAPSGPRAAAPAEAGLTQAKPDEGLIWRADNDMANVRFTVSAPAGGMNYLVSLFKEPEDRLALIMYVSAGQTHSTQVAEGSYQVRYKFGETWYGPKDLFGRNTAHGTIEEYMRFDADKGDTPRTLRFDKGDRTLYEQQAGIVPRPAPARAQPPAD